MCISNKIDVYFSKASCTVLVHGLRDNIFTIFFLREDNIITIVTKYILLDDEVIALINALWIIRAWVTRDLRVHRTIESRRPSLLFTDAAELLPTPTNNWKPQLLGKSLAPRKSTTVVEYMCFLRYECSNAFFSFLLLIYLENPARPLICGRREYHAKRK